MINKYEQQEKTNARKAKIVRVSLAVIKTTVTIAAISFFFYGVWWVCDHNKITLTEMGLCVLALILSGLIIVVVCAIIHSIYQIFYGEDDKVPEFTPGVEVECWCGKHVDKKAFVIEYKPLRGKKDLCVEMESGGAKWVKSGNWLTIDKDENDTVN